MNTSNGLTGWKTYLGGLVLIVTGLWLLSQGNDVEGVEAVGIGLAVIGIRHKLGRD